MKYYLNDDRTCVVKKDKNGSTYTWEWVDKEWVWAPHHFFIDGDCNFDEATKKEAEYAINNRTVPIYIYDGS